MLADTREIFLETQHGIKIALDHYKRGHDEVVILAHGWFISKDYKLFFDMSNIFSQNFDVIKMNFRGHGKSSGFYTFTSKEPQDLKSVVDYAKKHQYKKIYLIGFSLGAALVLIHSAKEKDVDKVIAVSPPHSFRKIENEMWRKDTWISYLGKFDPKRFFSVRPSPIIQKKTKPIDIVDKIEAPTLFIAGERDTIIRSWHTESLFEKANCKKHYELFKNCHHAEDLFLQNREKFLNVCQNWLLNAA